MDYAAELDALWRSHSKRLYGFMFKQVRNHEDTKDLLSSVYLRALVAMRNGNGYTQDAEAWIFTIARTALIDLWRTRQRTKWFVELDAQAEMEDSGFIAHNRTERILLSTEPSPHERAEQVILQEQVQRAIRCLIASHANLITLKLEGYTNGEIADMIGSNENAVKQLSVRAYANLREWLKEAA